MAKEINEVFFLPKLKNPVKTLDLPIGGKGYSNQSPLLIFEFVNLVNNVKSDDSINEDTDGSLTVEYLKKSKKVANLINSTHPSSLGLHPAVYFYSRSGRHKTASFFAIADFVIELEQKNKLKQFISIREQFEELLLDYDYVVQQILRYYRSSSNAVPHIKGFYIDLMDELQKSDKEQAVKNVLLKDNYKFIKADEFDGTIISSKDFSSETKSAVFITEALEKALRCKICNARIHTNSITFDHKQRKEDGGLGRGLSGILCNLIF